MTKKVPTETTYRVKDLGEATALLVHGQKLKEIEKAGKGMVFVFDDTLTCEKLGDKYWTDRLMVPAREFSLRLRGLKNQIHRSGSR